MPAICSIGPGGPPTDATSASAARTIRSTSCEATPADCAAADPMNTAAAQNAIHRTLIPSSSPSVPRTRPPIVPARSCCPARRTVKRPVGALARDDEELAAEEHLARILLPHGRRLASSATCREPDQRDQECERA